MNEQTLRKLRNVGHWSSVYCRTHIFQSVFRRIFRRVDELIEVHDFDGNFTLDLLLSEHMQRRIFWMGYYNLEIVALLDRIVERDMTIIDAGANIGEIALVAANRTGPTGHVIAFEPIDHLADRLQSHIDRNGLTQVTVVRSGLSDRAGTAPIYNPCQDEREKDENYGLGYLYGASTGARALQMVELNSLDNYLRAHTENRVDIIKIDIEGSELPCLKGARETLEEFSPMLIVEVQKQSATAAGYRQEDILDFLSALGYSFQRIERGGKVTPLEKDGLADYQNVFCTRSATDFRNR